MTKKESKRTELTPKQKLFADLYIELGHGTEAAIRAGYSKKTARSIASQNLEKPIIKDYIAKIMDQKDKERIASQDEVLKYLTSIMRGEQTEQTLRGVGEGEQRIDDIEVSAKDRIKAAELLGKRYAIWTDKKDLNGNVALTFVDDLDD